MRNLEMRLRFDQEEWRLYPLARCGRWLACWDRWRSAGGGLLASATREIGWDEAKRMIVAVAAMDDTAFQNWHAQTLAILAEVVQPTVSAGARGRLAQRGRRVAVDDRSSRSADDRAP
jgi:hypothetical protein